MRREPPVREMGRRPAQVVHLFGGAVRDEVAGHHDDRRPQRVDSAERLDQIVIVDFRPDVNVADLDEQPAFQLARKVRDRHPPPREVHPVRLDPPGVEAGRRAGTRGHAPEPLSSRHAARPTAVGAQTRTSSRRAKCSSGTAPGQVDPGSVSHGVQTDLRKGRLQRPRVVVDVAAPQPAVARRGIEAIALGEPVRERPGRRVVHRSRRSVTRVERGLWRIAMGTPARIAYRIAVSRLTCMSARKYGR